MTDHEKRIREALCLADQDEELITVVASRDLRALLADLDAMRADARRYAAFFTSGLPVCFEGQDHYSKADCDATIDAALLAYAQRTLGRERSLCESLAAQAEELAEHAQ